VVAKETFAKEDTEMTAQLTRIKGTSPGAVIIWGTNPGPALAAKNARTVGLKAPIIMSHGVASAKFLELAGEAANGVQLPAGRLIVRDQIAATDPQKAVLDAFAAEFSAKYGSPPDTFAGHAYDAVNLVVKALEAAGAADRTKLRDALEQVQGFVGTAGVFNYSATDHNGLKADAFVWVKIEGGKWKLAE
jgi:branched-chain amino acid transport system substrate-binding protein